MQRSIFSTIFARGWSDAAGLWPSVDCISLSLFVLVQRQASLSTLQSKMARQKKRDVKKKKDTGAVIAKSKPPAAAAAWPGHQTDRPGGGGGGWAGHQTDVEMDNMANLNKSQDQKDDKNKKNNTKDKSKNKTSSLNGGSKKPAQPASQMNDVKIQVHNDTIRYDTRCYFNVRSKANMSQLNLPHRTNN